jgi:hypothetical protein
MIGQSSSNLKGQEEALGRSIKKKHSTPVPMTTTLQHFFWR